jgi:hypothetical protein
LVRSRGGHEAERILPILAPALAGFANHGRRVLKCSRRVLKCSHKVAGCPGASIPDSGQRFQMKGKKDREKRKYVRGFWRGGRSGEDGL